MRNLPKQCAREAPAKSGSPAERLRISYATTYDASDVRHWSGTGHYLAKALEKQACDLDFIGPLPRSKPLWPFFKAKGLLYNHILNRRYHPEHDVSMARHYARLVQHALRQSGKTDVILSPGAIPVAFLETDRPIAIWSDATHACLFDFYPEYSEMSARMVRDGHRIEQSAIDRASAVIFSSDWAAESAVRDYGADPGKVHVVPYGANLEPPSMEAVTRAVKARPRRICKLLFIGVDWGRKGGETALAVAEALNKRGLPTELTVVGCSPFETQTQPDFVRCEGFLSKLVEEDRDKMTRLLAESHFLIVPSRAECFGIVYCEANSFGVPCLARAVGGIPTIVRNGRNGFLFEPNASPEAYVKLVQELFDDYGRYLDLAFSSMNEFQTRLNWNVAGYRVRKILLNVSRK